MKKYTLSELTKEVTGSNEDDYYWESKKESIRNIQRALNGVQTNGCNFIALPSTKTGSNA